MDLDEFAYEIATELMAAMDQNPEGTVQIEVGEGFFYKIRLSRYGNREFIMRDSRAIAAHALEERGLLVGMTA